MKKQGILAINIEILTLAARASLYGNFYGFLWVLNVFITIIKQQFSR